LLPVLLSLTLAVVPAQVNNIVDRVMRDIETLPPPAQSSLEEQSLELPMPWGCWGPTCARRDC